MTLLAIMFFYSNMLLKDFLRGVVISGLIFIVLIYVIHILTQYEGPWGYAQCYKVIQDFMVTGLFAGQQYYIHHVPERRLNRTERFYAFTIQIQIIQLLIFIE